MTTAASYLKPEAKWHRVNPARIEFRNPDQSWRDATCPFEFSSRSYRRATVHFDSAIDRIVMRTSQDGTYPVDINTWGLVTVADIRELASPIVWTLSRRSTGLLNIGSAAPGPPPPRFWFHDIYGEVWG